MAGDRVTVRLQADITNSAENLISISTRNMLRLKNVQRIQESMKM